MVTVSKEAVRWFKSLYSNPPGFDLFSHITGPSEQKLLENRMDAMKNTIQLHRPRGNAPIALKFSSNKFFLDPFDSLQVDMEGKYTTDNSGRYLCIKRYPPKGSPFKPEKCNWSIKSITNYSDYNGWTMRGKDNCLIKARHTSIGELGDADYVKKYGIPSNTTIIAWKGDDRYSKKYGFWLFKEEEADFIYAILHSDMFRAWCELTACTTWSDENGNQRTGIHKGDGDFSAGMWDTFYFLEDINLRKEEIKSAGRDLRNDVAGAQDTLNRFIDSLVLGSSISGLEKNNRLQILADRFQKDFTDLKTKVINLYLS